MIKLIVLDLDGTLLCCNSISDTNLSTILSIKEATKICIATGRSYKSSIRFAKQAFADYLITSDGLCIWDLNKDIKLTTKRQEFFNAFMISLPFDNLINKGTALKKLCKAINIPLKNTLAIGDGNNDIELIQYAGIGATTSNAIPAVKIRADYISPFDNYNNGVADIITKYCLSS